MSMIQISFAAIALTVMLAAVPLLAHGELRKGDVAPDLEGGRSHPGSVFDLDTGFATRRVGRIHVNKHGYVCTDSGFGIGGPV